MKQGHNEKANNIDESCFVSAAKITVKKDKSVKIALESRKLNDITIKRKAEMPNMEELFSRISRKIADGLRIWSATFLQRRPQPVHICRNRWKLYRLLPFPKGILRVSGHTDHFSED